MRFACNIHRLMYPVRNYPDIEWDLHDGAAVRDPPNSIGGGTLGDADDFKDFPNTSWTTTGMWWLCVERTRVCCIS